MKKNGVKYVLILITVEDTLGGRKNLHKRTHWSVLILITVEDTLGVICFDEDYPDLDYVLILITVEDTLGDVTMFEVNADINSLNPYYCGRYARRL